MFTIYDLNFLLRSKENPFTTSQYSTSFAQTVEALCPHHDRTETIVKLDQNQDLRNFYPRIVTIYQSIRLKTTRNEKNFSGFTFILTSFQHFINRPLHQNEEVQPTKRSRKKNIYTNYVQFSKTVKPLKLKPLEANF